MLSDPECDLPGLTPCHVCAGTGLTPCPQLRRDCVPPVRPVGRVLDGQGRHVGVRTAMSAPGLVFTGTGLTPPTSSPGLGSPIHICTRTGLTPAHICTRTGRAPATSAPGLGSPLPTSAPGLGSPSPLPHLRPDWVQPLPHRRRDWRCVARLRSKKFDLRLYVVLVGATDSDGRAPRAFVHRDG